MMKRLKPVLFRPTSRRERTPGYLLADGKTGWVAGIRWVQGGVSTGLTRYRQTDSFCIAAGKGTGQVSGLVSPQDVRRGMTLYSLAMVFLLAVGGSSYGIYRLDGERWVFLATVRGRLSVMGDITGSLNDVLMARNQFLEFNEPDDAGWHCAAEPEQALSWQTLVRDLPRAHLRQARLRSTSPARLLQVAAGVVVLGLLALWLQDASSRRARQAAAEAAWRAQQAVEVPQPETQAELPHPWADRMTVPALLSQCRASRAPLRMAVEGWPLTAWECTASPAGLRLNYAATPGVTVEAFARQVQVLYGRPAAFNLKDGAQGGEVFFPFETTEPAGWLRDELPGPADTRLMTLLSDLQRRDIRHSPVSFSEVTPPETAPGTKSDVPVQTWREYTFSVTTPLRPELLFTGVDDTGLRLSSIGFTRSTQGQSTYTIKGSLYVQK